MSLKPHHCSGSEHCAYAVRPCEGCLVAPHQFRFVFGVLIVDSFLLSATNPQVPNFFLTLNRRIARIRPGGGRPRTFA